LTVPVTELPPIPTDPEGLKAWAESLNPEQLREVVHHITRGPADKYVGPSNPPIVLPPPPDEPNMLTLTIELRRCKPRIWRRLALPGDLTLDAVHLQFQAAMGWSESHLHRFEPGDGRKRNQPYFITAFDEEEGDEGTREEEVRLDQVLQSPGDRLTYHYDFGDGWEHLVTLEAVAPRGVEAEPRCLGGAKACPQEDCGGPYGYQEIADWLRAGAQDGAVPQPFDDAEQARSWLPIDYDPDAFDPDEATAAMRQWAAGEHLPWHSLPEPLANLIMSVRGPSWVQLDAWLAHLGPREPVELSGQDTLAAARPWAVLLNVVGPQTKLTSAGYLPPALVLQAAQDLGITEWWIGKANREDMLWPLAQLREAAQAVGLLRKAKGVLKPTARAAKAADDPRGIIAAVLQRLPLGKGFEVDAGWLTLLGLAAGVTGSELDAGVAQMLTDRGWRINRTLEVGPMDAQHGAQATTEALDWMAGGFRNIDPGLRQRLARAVLLGLE
jgi:hypothetical protein